jgi:small subunit ribosomal protein S15
LNVHSMPELSKCSFLLLFNLQSVKLAKMITKETKTKVIADAQTHKADVGSPQVQVSVLTTRIKEVTDHLRNNKHDFHARRGLMQMVGRRKRLLKYLQDKNYDAYTALIAKLGLRK